MWLFLFFVDPLLAARHAHDPEAVERVLEVYAAIDAATKDSELRVELRRICQRESWCNRFEPVNEHVGDAWASRRMWLRAVEKGWLDPDACPEHAYAPGEFAPRGVMGISPAWTLRFVDGCEGPQIHDTPRHAVELAVQWMGALCDSVGACDCESRAVWWQGPGVWNSRSAVRKLRSVERQCGRLGAISRLAHLLRYSVG